MEMNLKKGDGSLGTSGLATLLLELADTHGVVLERDSFCDALWACAIPGMPWPGVVRARVGGWGWGWGWEWEWGKLWLPWPALPWFARCGMWCLSPYPSLLRRLA
jgi:hypothetical protein